MSRRSVSAFLALPAALALSACGGTKHVSEITPVLTQRVSGASPTRS